MWGGLKDFKNKKIIGHRTDRFGRQEGRKCWGEEEKNKKYF